MFHQRIAFHGNNHPHFSDLFIIKDAHFTNIYWLIIKSGHFTGFGILEVLIYAFTRNRVIAASITIGYAVTTEIFQLYFNRDGRFLDMGIDTAGVLVAICIWRMVNKLK